MKQINALEKHLELQLVERTAHGIRLTAAGQVHLPARKAAVRVLEQAVAEAKRHLQTAQTTLRIGSSLLNPCKPFMDLWYQLDREFSSYRLNIVPFRTTTTSILSKSQHSGKNLIFLIGVCDSQLWLNYCNSAARTVSALHRRVTRPSACRQRKNHAVRPVRRNHHDGQGRRFRGCRCHSCAALRQHPQIHVETPRSFAISRCSTAASNEIGHADYRVLEGCSSGARHHSGRVGFPDCIRTAVSTQSIGRNSASCCMCKRTYQNGKLT